MSVDVENIGRNLDLVSKLQLNKLAKEVSESDNKQAIQLLGFIEKLNTKIEASDDEDVEYWNEDEDEDDDDLGWD